MTPYAMRWIHAGIGGLCTALGIVGAFLPVMPTTPFLLVAVWAFSKSSPRLENWLLTHPRYGPTLRDWREYGAIGRSVKVVALSAMAVSLVFVHAITGSMLATLLHGVVVTLTGLFILSRPSARPRRD